ncbi:MAG: glycosyltransferase [Xenococcus sp. (in: cyanobacteria)]
MKKKILTLLVSRFNCPHRVWNDRTLEEYNNWLQLRLDLFSRYTLKSYKNLDTKPDSWILLVQREKLSNQILDELCGLLKGEAYQLVECSSSIRESILKYLENTYNEDDFPEEIRTTRLDTDDLISRDFFDQINSVVLEEDTNELLISFPGGANYDVNTGLFYYLCYPDNSFLTLCQKISKLSDFKCVYDEKHLTFHKVVQKNLYMVSFFPMWCWDIH